MIRNSNPFTPEYYYSPTDLLGSARFEVSPYNSMLVEGDQEDGIHVQSDIELLRRSQEYAKYHPELFADFFERIAPSSPLADLRANLSDEELMTFLKSRRCQTPAELQQYADYINDVYKDRESEFTEYVKQVVQDYVAERSKPLEDKPLDKPAE